MLTYTLGGTDEASFDIDESTGQLITKAPLNADTDTGGKTSYSVTVTVNDGHETNNSATEDVTITVTDVNEPPAAPAPPVITTGSTTGQETTTLEINWYAPENTGETINDYDYRYKKTTGTTWTTVDDATSTATNVTISSLEADTAYQVSVRAGSPEGDGLWSLSAVGSTNKAGNAAPVFPNTENGQRSILENTPSGQRVGAAVTATDANSITLNYSLAGEDADSFHIEESTGEILTKAALNFEGDKTAYTVLVVVDDDGDGGSDVITVTITVTDEGNERPSRPAAPTVEMVEDDPVTNDENPATNSDDESATRLKVSWVAPETTGPAITGYNPGVPERHERRLYRWATGTDRHECHNRQLGPRLVLPGAGDGNQRRGEQPAVSSRDRENRTGQQGSGVLNHYHQS